MSRAVPLETAAAELSSSIAHSRELEAALSKAVEGEVRFDPYSRHLFSTDASMYAIEPLGVVSPRDADDVVAVVEIARRFGVPILPRGGGTSLAGQTQGRAIVLDFSRHMNQVLELEPESKIAVVQPGLVQDDLNRAVAGHGLLFAPDTSTGNRATLGGMLGNNSCGARSARYGMTIDHVDKLKVVLSDASLALLEPATPEEIRARADANSLEGALYREIPALIAERSDAIRSAVPDHWRRTGGYRPWRLMEDIDLARRMHKHGPLKLIRTAVGVSPRRFEAGGFFRTALRNQLILAAYYAGISPDRLSRFYGYPAPSDESS